MNRFIRTNERIRVNEVRLIDAEGNQLGVVGIQEALSKAREDGFDLVEVAPEAKPPVCRIMDFSKFKYEQSKREKEARKKQKIFHVKEVRCKPNIEDHDYMVKLNNARRFLKKGDKVKISLMFKGREMAHPELGKKIIDRFVNDLQEEATIEKGPVLEGRFINLIVGPKAA